MDPYSACWSAPPQGVSFSRCPRAAPNRAHPAIPRRPPGNVLAGIPLYFVDRARELFARLRQRHA